MPITEAWTCPSLEFWGPERQLALIASRCKEDVESSCRVEFVFSFEELLYASRSLWVAEGRVRRYTLAHEDCHRIEPNRFRVPPGQDPRRFVTAAGVQAVAE
jgi:hypothetical protein